MKSGSLFFLIAHLHEYADSIVFKQFRVFGEHVAAEFQVLLSLVHVMVSKINGQERYRIIYRTSFFSACTKEWMAK